MAEALGENGIERLKTPQVGAHKRFSKRLTLKVKAVVATVRSCLARELEQALGKVFQVRIR